MNKLFTLLICICFATYTNAQSQRMVLVEEFTQASCGPCASQNPAFNTLLSNNTSKVISLKYQTSWPGVDPMNAQNPTQVANRVSYYTVNSVPVGIVDGVKIPNTCNAYVGAPACLSQSAINTAYAVPAAFDIDLFHSISANYDSIFITATVTASMDITVTGPLKLHLALAENEIRFATAPGTNGEKEFFNVMRKMYPSEQGSTLSSFWISGQSETITIAAAMPSYIYSYSQIVIVGFIQDDSNKMTMQAKLSEKLPLTFIDGIAASISSIPFVDCATTITPVVKIENSNASNGNINTADIIYRIDAGATSTYSFSGSLAPGATTNVTLPAIQVTGGSHTFYAMIKLPNGNTDFQASNDTSKVKFAVISGVSALPVSEGFQSTFPPANWLVNNIDGDAATWTKRTGAGGNGASNACAKMDFYNSPRNFKDELFLPAYNFTNSNNAAYLTFNVAYAQYTAATPENDRLDILVSTDCGANWTSVYSQMGNDLKTADPTTSVFTPTASQWRKDSVELGQFAGNAEVLIKFVGISNYGNNLYVDDINMIGSVGIASNKFEGNIELFPNPTSSDLFLNATFSKPENMSVEVFNILGESVSRALYNNTINGTFEINLTNVESGFYNVRISTDDSSITRKISVTK